jgi:galactitol-specific phosphotransferase system IIB component
MTYSKFKNSFNILLHFRRFTTPLDDAYNFPIMCRLNPEVIYMKRVGIEKGLKDIADYLSNEGYSVQTLSESLENNTSMYNGLDVIVAADYNTDMMGFSDTETKVPVVNASGLTPQEIKSLIDQKVNK